jgi:hypothetical protein
VLGAQKAKLEEQTKEDSGEIGGVAHPVPSVAVSVLGGAWSERRPRAGLLKKLEKSKAKQASLRIKVRETERELQFTAEQLEVPCGPCPLALRGVQPVETTSAAGTGDRDGGAAGDQGPVGGGPTDGPAAGGAGDWSWPAARRRAGGPGGGAD